MPFDSLGGLAAVAGLLGLCVGSFLNVVIHRLPKMMEQEWQAQCADLRGETPSIATAGSAEPAALSLARPRSRCPACGHQITALENIPVVSYLLLRGKCSNCAAPISLRYPVIEVLAALLSAYAAWHFGPTLQMVGALVLLWALIALTVIDYDTQLLPDSITLPLLWFGLAFNLAGTYTDISSAVIGAMVGYLTLWSIFWAFKLATGKEGMGYGDFKLLAALGAWLGWQMLPVIILLSSVVGAAVGISLIVFNRHGRNTPIPFGPYLAAAGCIALFWGSGLTRSYLGLVT
ncbi:MAG: A24 family peptidase [Azonexus sp.]